MLAVRLIQVNKQKQFDCSSYRELLHETAEQAIRLGMNPNSQWPSDLSVISLCLSFVSEDKIKELNSRFREVDKVTDVLSFPMLQCKNGELLEEIHFYDWQDPHSEEKELFLGDIVICPEQAIRQSEEYQHSLQRELSFLTAHACLHLLGYDHIEVEDEELMRSKQRECMKSIGLNLQEPELQEDLISEQADTKAGFIALIGRPNVGKSTLLNHLIGSQLAITSPKPQTTRHLIRAVLNKENAQLVFLDSPGVHPPKHELDRSMSKAVSLAMDEADIIVLLIEASFKARVDNLELRVAKRAIDRGKTLIVALNKVDIAKKENMLPLIAAYSDKINAQAYIPISARTGEGVEALIDELIKYLPQRDFIFSDEDYTDQTERVIAQEYIRLELLRQMDDEIPHGTAVNIESFEESFDPFTGNRERVLIEAIIVTERENHKGMILGKEGSRIKEIGIKSRERISELLDCPCDLKLFVKVKENWRQRPQVLRELGYGKKEELQ